MTRLVRPLRARRLGRDGRVQCDDRLPVGHTIRNVRLRAVRDITGHGDSTFEASLLGEVHTYRCSAESIEAATERRCAR